MSEIKSGIWEPIARLRDSPDGIIVFCVNGKYDIGTKQGNRVSLNFSCVPYDGLFCWIEPAPKRDIVYSCFDDDCGREEKMEDKKDE